MEQESNVIAVCFEHKRRQPCFCATGASMLERMCAHGKQKIACLECLCEVLLADLDPAEDL